MNRFSSLLPWSLWLTLLLQGPLQAAEVRLREDAPDRYEVVEGDTLWDIAGLFLDDPWRWPRIWDANDQIENPHLIYPGDVIALRYVDGEPVLSLQRGSELPVVKLSPQVRRSPLRSPIPAIELSAISARLQRHRIISQADIDQAPYLLAPRSERLMAAEGEVVFARGDWSEGMTTYEILRPADVLTDPVSNESIGVQAQFVGQATLLTRTGDQATLRLGSGSQEARRGDLLLPRSGQVIDTRYFPRPPEFEVDARILKISSGLTYGGSHDTLIINLGEQDNIQVGHLLTLQKPDQTIQDPRGGDAVQFPGEKFASILVYRVFDQAALALVLDSRGPIMLQDRVVTP